MKFKEIEVNINGLPNPVNVDLEAPIQISWNSTSYWRNYKLDIIDIENYIVYSAEEKNYVESFHYFKLKESNKREKFKYSLVLSNNEHSVELEGVFFTENLNFLKSKWITRLDDPHEKERMYFREKNNTIFKKTIEINEPIAHSIIDISGLGYYVLYINNKRVGDSYLTTDVTNYSKTIFYDSFDIQDYLKEGLNEVEVHLGNGWYNPAPLGILGKYNIRNQLAVGKQTLKALIEIKTATGEVIEINTDESWSSSAGKLLYNDVYIGEIYDDGKIKNVIDKTVIVKGPQGKLTPSFIPKIKRKKEFLHEKLLNMRKLMFMI